MLDMLKTKLTEALHGLQDVCDSAVIRDDDGDEGDIATPSSWTDDEA